MTLKLQILIQSFVINCIFCSNVWLVFETIAISF